MIRYLAACVVLALWSAPAGQAPEPPSGQSGAPAPNLPGRIREAREFLAEERAEYYDARRFLFRRERELGFDAGLRPTAGESRANAFLVALRNGEIEGYKAQRSFPPARSFFDVKKAIEGSRLFGILRKMPKGGALHIHSSSAGRARWVVDDAIRRANCHVYWPDGDGSGGGHVKGELRFFKPGSASPAGFRPVAEVRAATKDFDRQLLELLTLGPEDGQAVEIWSEFGPCFARLSGFLSYQPVFVDFFVDAFETLLADGVDYVELRTALGTLYDLEGNTWSQEKYIDQYLNVRTIVREKHPDFDFKLIITTGRGAVAKDVWESVREAVALRAKYPDFVVGFDLVGEEDAGKRTVAFRGVWERLPALCAQHGVDLPLFFHDGESDWPDDRNLFDAFLLGTRRIGHGFNLYLFPALERRLIERDVAVEVCPISNQVLRYVSDLRIHPANGCLRRGVQCVLSSDDPLIFGYEGLSYDFWEALMAWDLDLLSLKKLALNSIDYSAMTPEEKRLARIRWEKKWEAFVRFLETERQAGGNTAPTTGAD